MEPAPHTIDGYTVIRELGRGGMGVVYEVRDPELGRPLALKLMLQSAADAESLLRFGQESELLARIKHPNVVRVHGVGRSAEGPYIVTERIEGEALDRVLGWGPLTPQRAAEVVRDLCGAVAALHAAGVIHRDLKAKNIILRRDGTPVLIDFGLARDEQVERLTQTGTVMGTPYTMSPEQARGDTHRIGPATDVYGLGAVLFSLLAGSAPFEGLPQPALFEAIARLEPTWPMDVAPNVPPVLEAICRRAMSKDPSARPDAEGLRAELDGFLAAEVTAAPPGWTFAVAGAAAAVLILVGLYAALAPTRPRSVAKVPAPAPSPAPADSERGAAVDSKRVDRLETALDAAPSEELFEEARELLAAGGAHPRLRKSYVRARILHGRPVKLFAHTYLPEGRARWFEGTRVLLGGRMIGEVWCWDDLAPGEPDHKLIDHGKRDRYAARPLVFGSRIFCASGEAAREVLVSGWGQKEPPLRIPLELQPSAFALRQRGDCELLAVGTSTPEVSREGTILLFELRGSRAELVRTLVGSFEAAHNSTMAPESHGPRILDLIFSRDGRHLISGGYDGQVVVWDLTSGEPITKTSVGQGAAVLDLALRPSRDPKRTLLVASTGLGRQVHSITVPGLEKKELWRYTGCRANEASFSPDGRFLYLAGGVVIDNATANERAGELVVLDMGSGSAQVTGQEVTHLEFSDRAILSIDVSPDGRYLLMHTRREGKQAVLEVWDVDVPPSD